MQIPHLYRRIIHWIAPSGNAAGEITRLCQLPYDIVYINMPLGMQENYKKSLHAIGTKGQYLGQDSHIIMSAYALTSWIITGLSNT